MFVQIYGFISTLKNYYSTTSPTGGAGTSYEKYNDIKGAINYYPNGTKSEQVFEQSLHTAFTVELQNLLDVYTNGLGNNVSGKKMGISIRKLKDLGEFI